MKPSKGDVRVDIGLLILRIGVGLTMFVAGSQKMLGIFGGNGFGATVEMFDKVMGIPPVFAYLAIAAEFFGSLGILVGFLCPVAAFGVTCTMAVAVVKVASMPGTLHDAFSGGDASKLSLPVLMFFAALAVLLLGPGNYSLDAKFFRRSR